MGGPQKDSKMCVCVWVLTCLLPSLPSTFTSSTNLSLSYYSQCQWRGRGLLTHIHTSNYLGIICTNTHTETEISPCSNPFFTHLYFYETVKHTQEQLTHQCYRGDIWFHWDTCETDKHYYDRSCVCVCTCSQTLCVLHTLGGRTAAVLWDSVLLWVCDCERCVCVSLPVSASCPCVSSVCPQHGRWWSSRDSACDASWYPGWSFGQVEHDTLRQETPCPHRWACPAIRTPPTTHTIWRKIIVGWIN